MTHIIHETAKVGEGTRMRLECQHFVDCITQKKTPFIDGKNGLEVVRVLEVAQESLNKIGQPARLQ